MILLALRVIQTDEKQDDRETLRHKPVIGYEPIMITNLPLLPGIGDVSMILRRMYRKTTIDGYLTVR